VEAKAFATRKHSGQKGKAPLPLFVDARAALAPERESLRSTEASCQT
jgi:hypothetical protein